MVNVWPRRQLCEISIGNYVFICYFYNVSPSFYLARFVPLCPLLYCLICIGWERLILGYVSTFYNLLCEWYLFCLHVIWKINDIWQVKCSYLSIFVGISSLPKSIPNLDHDLVRLRVLWVTRIPSSLTANFLWNKQFNLTSTPIVFKTYLYAFVM